MGAGSARDGAVSGAETSGHMLGALGKFVKGSFSVLKLCLDLPLTPTHSSPLQPKLPLGLPLILWTPSVHNQRREVPHGPTATEFHAGV